MGSCDAGAGAGADAKRGKTTRPFQCLPKSGWAGAGDRVGGGWARRLALLFSWALAHSRRWAIMALATTWQRVASSTPSTARLIITADD